MFLLILFIIVIVFVIVCIVIVPKNNEFVVEQLGKYHKTLKAIVNFRIPFLQRVINKINLKEHIHDFQLQMVITKGNSD